MLSAFENHTEKDRLDVPLKVYLNEKSHMTTLRDEMKGVKIALIVNVASK